MAVFYTGPLNLLQMKHFKVPLRSQVVPSDYWHLTFKPVYFRAAQKYNAFSNIFCLHLRIFRKNTGFFLTSTVSYALVLLLMRAPKFVLEHIPQ